MEWRHRFLLAHWVLMFVGTHWPEINRYKPETGWPIPHFSETVHALLYGTWAALWWWVLARNRGDVDWGTLGIIVSLGFLYACFDEATQLLVGRTGKFYDVFVDTLAVFVVLGILKGLHRIRVAGN